MSGFSRKRFVLLPFANKNEVFITKQGFVEPLKTSFACFLRGLSIKNFATSLYLYKFFYRLVQQNKAYKNCTKYKLIYKFVLKNLINLCAILIFLVTITDVSFLYTFTIYTKYDKYKF